MASYNYTANTDYQSLNKSFKRVSDTQLMDVTGMFNSFADALKYAKQNRKDPDERRLYRASYVGQIITVYENGEIVQYKITEERELQRVTPIEVVKVNGEELPADSEAAIDITIPDYVGGDGVNVDETTGGTKQIDVMKIDCGEY